MIRELRGDIINGLYQPHFTSLPLSFLLVATPCPVLSSSLLSSCFLVCSPAAPSLTFTAASLLSEAATLPSARPAGTGPCSSTTRARSAART